MKAAALNRVQVHQGSLLLVNRNHPLQCTIPPEQIRPLEHSTVSLERKTALVLETLLSTIGSGSSIVPVSGFRTHKEQEEIYASSLRDHGEVFTRNYVALPGCSEHETGLAIDLALKR